MQSTSCSLFRRTMKKISPRWRRIQRIAILVDTQSTDNSLQRARPSNYIEDHEVSPRSRHFRVISPTTISLYSRWTTVIRSFSRVHSTTLTKDIILIKVGEHYHVCNPLSGFLGRSYSCVECEKSFENDDMQHHPFNGKKCCACHQTRCDDYHRTRGEWLLRRKIWWKVPRIVKIVEFRQA